MVLYGAICQPGNEFIGVPDALGGTQRVTRTEPVVFPQGLVVIILHPFVQTEKRAEPRHRGRQVRGGAIHQRGERTEVHQIHRLGIFQPPRFRHHEIPVQARGDAWHEGLSKFSLRSRARGVGFERRTIPVVERVVDPPGLGDLENRERVGGIVGRAAGDLGAVKTLRPFLRGFDDAVLGRGADERVRGRGEGFVAGEEVDAGVDEFLAAEVGEDVCAKRVVVGFEEGVGAGEVGGCG